MADHLTILLMRHAHAEVAAPNQSDCDRSLDEEGRGEAQRMGCLLRQKQLLPGLILTSTAKRAQETAQIVANGFDEGAEIKSSAELYLAESGQILDVLREVDTDQSCVLVVGHNPGMAELVTMMTKEYCSMPTAGVAEIHLALASTSQILKLASGRLHCFYQPPPQLEGSEVECPSW